MKSDTNRFPVNGFEAELFRLSMPLQLPMQLQLHAAFYYSTPFGRATFDGRIISPLNTIHCDIVTQFFDLSQELFFVLSFSH